MIDPNNTTLEMEAEAPDTAILGIGSFEQHSSHLPLDTDFFFAARISGAVAERLEAVLLHPLPYSTSLEHLGFAGTVTLKPDTLKRIVWEIAESVERWGIRYLALINAHGGNFILNPAARQWNMEGRSPRLMLIDYYVGLSDTGENVHAGEVETSLMLYLAPERVGKAKPDDFLPSWERPDLTHLGMKRISPTGVWGNPGRASAEKGERWFEEAVHYCTAKIGTLTAQI